MPKREMQLVDRDEEMRIVTDASDELYGIGAEGHVAEATRHLGALTYGDPRPDEFEIRRRGWATFTPSERSSSQSPKG